MAGETSETLAGAVRFGFVASADGPDRHSESASITSRGR